MVFGFYWGNVMSQENKLLTLSEGADLLRLDQKRTRRLAKAGKLPGSIVLPGGEVRFDRKVLNEWLTQQVVGGDNNEK